LSVVVVKIGDRREVYR